MQYSRKTKPIVDSNCLHNFVLMVQPELKLVNEASMLGKVTCLSLSFDTSVTLEHSNNTLQMGKKQSTKITLCKKTDKSDMTWDF